MPYEIMYHGTNQEKRRMKKSDGCIVNEFMLKTVMLYERAAPQR